MIRAEAVNGSSAIHNASDMTYDTRDGKLAEKERSEEQCLALLYAVSGSS